MSFLDLYPRDQAADARIQPNERPDLPATPDEAFHAAWSQGQLFSSSIAGDNSRTAALQDYLDEVEKKTGKNIGAGLDYGGAGGAMPVSMLREQANTAVDKLRADYPDLAPLTDDDLEQRAIKKSREANDAYAQMATREKSFRATAAFEAGGFASGAADPINLLALPIAPETAGGTILAAALKWGAVAATAQSAVEVAGAPFREEVQPGYGTSGQPVLNVAEAFGGGVLLGGGTKLLGNMWSRVKTGEWPQSVRDAGNVIESEANVANTNVYGGVEGEVAHREALVKTIDDVTSGRPTDVSAEITPELTAAREARMSDILGSRGEAIASDKEARAERAQIETSESPDLPFQQTAKEAEVEGHLGDVAFGVQRIAKDAGYAMPRDEAERLAGRIVGTTDDEARQILDAVSTNPQTIDTVLAERGKALPEPEVRRDVSPPADITTPQHAEALRADIDRDRMVGDRQIPIDVDKNGEPVYRSLDGAMDEVDAYKTAAEHIEACAGPPQAEKAA